MARLPDDDHGGTLLVTMQILFSIIGTLAVALRITAKEIRDRPWQAHDFLCFFCYLCMLGYAVTIIAGTYYGGLGQHVNQLADDPSRLLISLKTFFASQWFYNIGAASMRLSILALYITIFQMRPFRIVAYGVASAVLAFMTAAIITVCVLCQPVALNWNRSLKGHCGSTLKTELASGGANAILDLTLTVIPLPVVWRLQMPARKKATVSAVFSLGVINCGINAGRIAQPLVSDFNDFTYSTVGAAILVTAEILTGLLVSSIPTYGPILAPGKFRSKYTSPLGRSLFSKKRRTAETPASDASEANLYSNKTSIRALNPHSFHKLDEESAPGEGPVELGSVAPGDESTESALEPSRLEPLESNVIGVRKDLQVFPTPRAHLPTDGLSPAHPRAF